MSADSLEKIHAAPKREPVPLWLLALAGFIVLFGGSVWWDNTGGFRADIYDTAQGAPIIGGSGPADPMVLGQRVFSRNCAVCHLPTGEGVSGQFPPLAGSEWVLGEDGHGDNHLVKVVLHGLQGPVVVRDRTFNGAMAPWGRILTNDQIAAVLTYIRNQWGNAAPPITPDFVARIRERNAARSEPWTPKALRDIPAEKNTTSPANPVPK